MGATEGLEMVGVSLIVIGGGVVHYGGLETKVQCKSRGGGGGAPSTLAAKKVNRPVIGEVQGGLL